MKSLKTTMERVLVTVKGVNAWTIINKLGDYLSYRSFIIVRSGKYFDSRKVNVVSVKTGSKRGVSVILASRCFFLI